MSAGQAQSCPSAVPLTRGLGQRAQLGLQDNLDPPPSLSRECPGPKATSLTARGLTRAQVKVSEQRSDWSLPKTRKGVNESFQFHSL